MTDNDEAAINLSSHDSAAHFETDLSDETQDFRMLNNISFLTDTAQTSLPKRGEKDFEPNPTLLQADILAASRQAMHNALSHPRVHHPKNKVVGFYTPDGAAPPPSLLSSKTIDTIAEDNANAPQNRAETDAQKTKQADGGIGNVPSESCVCIPNPKGQFFKTLGRTDRWNRVWLLPEEALYLLERGSLDIRWPSSLAGCNDECEAEGSSIPMSLQAAYSCFIGCGGLTMERFSVYTGLKRLGYSVIRAPGWYDDDTDTGTDPETAEMSRQGPGLAGIYGRFLEWFYKSNTTAVGPLVGPGIHRNYNDIYRKLAFIPWYDPVALTAQPRTSPPFRVVFHIYKPSTPFRKTAPPPPDFRIAVVNARTQTTVPTLAQIGSLLDSTPLDPPQGERMNRNLYMRLRQGYRNVIMAVVDQGVVSYLRIADAAFGKEKVYEDKAPKGNKRSGVSRPAPKGR
ncbi:tRNA-splicing endonuclease subunit SEN54 family protein [Aspergillus tanneri]|uniref:tRNA-splicing endonuclease subunit sen54 n=1 Tax=Aspergillus tanneri TaxID=1220188 RepID=A0A5M9N1B6_9EURO|nr:tRNA-splicing endonuclease subunit sen54 [Aspergillus tanneri]KAA8650933.1 tRNA-splicing endonuclease subunit sen54 [Aspergillus tanneri]